MMKIAIATENNHVSAHFGGSHLFTILDIEGSIVKEKSEIPAPPHQPGVLPKFLNEQGVTHIIAGGMGPKALQMFKAFKIECITGVNGSIDEVVKLFIENELEPGESQCNHGHHDHGHGQHHQGCQQH